MPRRHGRMFLRGKPGLFVLVAVLSIGIFLAYYTFGRSSAKPNKYAIYKNVRGSGKFPSYQIPKSNKGFSDKYNQGHQLPKPDFAAQRNFGGLRKNDLPKGGIESRAQSNFGGLRKIDLSKGGSDVDAMRQKNVAKYNSEEREIDENDYHFEDKVDRPPPPPIGDKIQRGPDEANSLEIYIKPDMAFSTLFKSMKRIVHLDLKGAFPKLSYLEKVLPLFQRLGATGLLVEYEDMFPYAGELSMLSAENAYSKKEISRLLELAKQNSLEVIPLIQTFGHMEFVLKHAQFQNLRESPNTPAVISPMHNESYALISAMINQVLDAHPDAKYIHIGSDEVYDLGKGKTNKLIVGGKTKDEIILKHISKVATLVKSKRNIGVIVWDDELRLIAEQLIMKSGLNSLVEPMVWSYIQDPRDSLPEDIWVKYGKVFAGIWAASSFKGATGSAQFYTNISHHLKNHLSWVNMIKKMKNEMPIDKFRGVALTGWQRYDHYATLCELLPEAIPSLAVCLETIMNGGFSPDIHRTTSKLLNCTALIELEVPKLNEDGSAVVSQDCSFPGSDFYYSTQQLWGVLNQYRRDESLNSLMQGWLTDYNVQHGFGNPSQMKRLVGKLDKITSSLYTLIDPVNRILKPIFDKYTINEWVDVNLKQRINRLNEKSQKAKVLLQKTTWPRRPLHDLIPGQMDSVGQNSRNAVQMQQDNQYKYTQTRNPNEQKVPQVQNQFGPKDQQGQYDNFGRQNPGFDNQGKFQGGKGRQQATVGNNGMDFPNADNNRGDRVQDRYQGNNRLNPVAGNQGLKDGTGRLIRGGNRGPFQDDRRTGMIGKQGGLKDDTNKRNEMIGNKGGLKDDTNRRNEIIGKQGGLKDDTRKRLEGNKDQFQGDNGRNGMIGRQGGLKDDTNRRNGMIGRQGGLKDDTNRRNEMIGRQGGLKDDTNRRNEMFGKQEGLKDDTNRRNEMIGRQGGLKDDTNRRNEMIGRQGGLKDVKERPLEAGNVGDNWRNKVVTSSKEAYKQKLLKR